MCDRYRCYFDIVFYMKNGDEIKLPQKFEYVQVASKETDRKLIGTDFRPFENVLEFNNLIKSSRDCEYYINSEKNEGGLTIFKKEDFTETEPDIRYSCNPYNLANPYLDFIKINVPPNKTGKTNYLHIEIASDPPEEIQYEIENLRPKIEDIIWNKNEQKLVIRGECMYQFLFPKIYIGSESFTKNDSIVISYQTRDYNTRAKTEDPPKCYKNQHIIFDIQNSKFKNSKNETVELFNLFEGETLNVSLLAPSAAFGDDYVRFTREVEFERRFLNMTQTERTVFTFGIIVGLLILFMLSVYIKQTFFSKFEQLPPPIRGRVYYEQHVPDKQKILKENIKLDEESGFLGKGAFGKVYKGTLCLVEGGSEKEVKNKFASLKGSALGSGKGSSKGSGKEKEVAIKSGTSLDMNNYATLTAFFDEIKVPLSISRHKHVLSIEGMYSNASHFLTENGILPNGVF